MDLILINGNVITMDDTNPRVEAVAIEDGKFSKVGINDEVLSMKLDTTEIIDLNGKMLVPGFNDSHMHLLSFGYSLQMVSLNGCGSIDELIARTKDFISSKKIVNNTWIRGRGWNQDHFVTNRFPNKYDLDKISSEHPICLTRACGHVSIVNSKALEIANISKETPQVEGGHFDVNENREPLGIFRENAMKLIYDIIPEPSISDIKNMIVEGANYALSQGITSVQSDDFEALPGKNFENVIKAYMELVEENKLPIRVYEQCKLPNIDRLKHFLDLGYNTGYGNELFKMGPLKLLGDGSLGARTAYMCEPYADDPSTCGIPIYTQEELDKLVLTAHDAGMQVAIHCIGDRIMYMAFDSIEKALKANPRDDHRHGIIHCQITDEKLLNKYKDMNAVAHIQPIFLHYDLHIVEDRVGKERAKTTYNWKTMLNKGINVACGSDCPVEPLDVLPGIYAAVTRMDLNGFPSEGWLPEQKLTVDEALYGFTKGAAYASFEEGIKGSIEIGKLADMTVLSEDIYEIDPKKIKDVLVEMTFVGGKLSYKRNM